jgi:hypothetical protein
MKLTENESIASSYLDKKKDKTIILKTKNSGNQIQNNDKKEEDKLRGE